MSHAFVLTSPTDSSIGSAPASIPAQFALRSQSEWKDARYKNAQVEEWLG